MWEIPVNSCTGVLRHICPSPSSKIYGTNLLDHSVHWFALGGLLISITSAVKSHRGTDLSLPWPLHRRHFVQCHIFASGKYEFSVTVNIFLLFIDCLYKGPRDTLRWLQKSRGSSLNFAPQGTKFRRTTGAPCWPNCTIQDNAVRAMILSLGQQRSWGSVEVNCWQECKILTFSLKLQMWNLRHGSEGLRT